MKTKTAGKHKRDRPVDSLPLKAVYDRLLAAWGPQGWWPGETDEEMVAGAILTQNTAWKNVEKAIANLKQARVLSIRGMNDLSLSALADLIRPAGYFNVKARRLRAFTQLIVERYNGRLSTLFKMDTSMLRSELLSVNGIGPETADSILLYAADRPVFVVDAYTRRFMERHGWARAGAAYDNVAGIFMTHLPPVRQVYNEYHALIVKLGKDVCKKRMPRCEACPLKEWPHKGVGS